MPRIETKKTRFGIGGSVEDQPVTGIEVLSGTTFGPSLGLSLTLADGSSRVIEFHVDEAFDLAVEILSGIRASENKFELNFGADWRRSEQSQTGG